MHVFQGKDDVVRRRTRGVIGVMSYGRYDQVEKRQEGGKECLAQFTNGKVAREGGKAEHMIRIR